MPLTVERMLRLPSLISVVLLGELGLMSCFDCEFLGGVGGFALGFWILENLAEFLGGVSGFGFGTWVFYDF